MFFDTSAFAETVTVYPDTGSSFTVSAVVDRSVSFNETEVGLVKQELADMEVSRDSLPSPVLGYAVVLSGDTTSEAYAFEAVLEGDEHSHLLRFVRTAPEEVGGNRQ